MAVAQVSVSFLFAYWDVSDCFSVKADALNSVGNRNVQYAADYFKKRYGISFSAGAMTADYLANKNDTLTGNFGFVSNKMAFTIGKLTEIKSHLLLTKAMQILPI
ncbi:hypothetical protein [Flavobacterium sp.]|uniref:hypothetical protein n=1 Tax=Flavobacterium sp. TaxID=239 RepID=UPI002616F48E|nr:hypothetical protein [Flavobacterium sp.]MDD3004575.1 hypothetical protein [Flavobacterium sp.]